MKIILRLPKMTLFILVVMLLMACSSNNSNVNSNQISNPIGNTWVELSGLNANGNVKKIVTDSQNNLYAIGNFTNAAGKYYVAKWNGSVWSELGNLNVDNLILTIIVDNNDNILIAGSFKNSSGKPYVAKWNGVTWSEMGSLVLPSLVFTNTAICNIMNDNLGTTYIAISNNNDSSITLNKWNGSNWSTTNPFPYGFAATGYLVNIKFDSTNSLCIGGMTTNLYKSLLTSWTAIDYGGLNYVKSFEFNSQDILYALLGDLNSVKLYKKNSSWSKVSDVLLSSSYRDKQNNLYFGGYQSNSNTALKCNVYQLVNDNLTSIGNISENQYYNPHLLVHDLTKDSNGVLYASVGDYLYGNFRVVKYIP